MPPWTYKKMMIYRETKDPNVFINGVLHARRTHPKHFGKPTAFRGPHDMNAPLSNEGGSLEKWSSPKVESADTNPAG